MHTGVLRDRLQRCRGELSQIIGIARDLEEDEAQNTSPGTPVGRRAESISAGHRAQAVTLLQRIRRAADSCAATLSEVEREVDVLTGSEVGSGFQLGDHWRRGGEHGSEGSDWSRDFAGPQGSRGRVRPFLGTAETYGVPRDFSRGASSEGYGYSDRRGFNRSGSQGYGYGSQGDFARTSLSSNEAYGESGGRDFGSYGRRREAMRGPIWNAQTSVSGGAHAETLAARYGRDQARSTYEEPGSYARSSWRTSDQSRYGTSAFTGRGSMPVSQQGGYDYGPDSTRSGWEPQNAWAAERRGAWERQPAYAAPGGSRY